MNSAADKAANNARHDTHPGFAMQSAATAYSSHAEAEAAVRCLVKHGMPAETISMIGHHFEAQGDIQGFYHPAPQNRSEPHLLDGLEVGAWVGGIFGLQAGATGFFVMPVVGAMMVLGPLAEMIAGALSGAGAGAGIGALTQGLLASGIPADQTHKYQNYLQSGGFLVAVHGNAGRTKRVHELLQSVGQAHPQSGGIPANTK